MGVWIVSSLQLLACYNLYCMGVGGFVEYVSRGEIANEGMIHILEKRELDRESSSCYSQWCTT